jgi:sigma-E factor negative regulatory protein RseB
VSADALKPQTQAHGYRWHRESLDSPPAPVAAPRWDVQPAPAGFRRASHVTRRTPVRQADVEHIVYSDGLATVSVFIERMPERGAMQGPNHIGAVHAYGRQVNGYQVTVVGEVPAETVRRFAGAMVMSADRRTAR